MENNKKTKLCQNKCLSNSSPRLRYAAKIHEHKVVSKASKSHFPLVENVKKEANVKTKEPSKSIEFNRRRSQRLSSIKVENKDINTSLILGEKESKTSFSTSKFYSNNENGKSPISTRKSIIETRKSSIAQEKTSLKNTKINKDKLNTVNSTESNMTEIIEEIKGVIAQEKLKSEICHRIFEKADATDDEMTEYEKLRQRNIEQREALLRELKIKELKEEASKAAGILAENNGKYVASKRGLAAQPKSKELLPPRKSLRLQNISAETGLKLPEKELKSWDLYQQDPERIPLEDLELKDFISSGNKSGDTEKVSNFISSLTGDLRINNTTKLILSDTHETPNRLKKLRITADQVAKVTPNRIFSLTVHPTERKLLIAAGEKWGGVGIWDANDFTSETHGVHLFSPHSRPVNCLTFDKANDTHLISTSYDGTIRSFDLEKQMSILRYGLDDDDNGYLTYHCQKDSSTILVSGADGSGKYSKGYVGVIDTRSTSKKFAHKYYVCAGSSSRTVAIHPSKSDMFVCSSRYGACRLFDMRGKNDSKNLIQPITSLIGHTKVVCSAFFSPLTGDKLATVCMDDKIRIYDLQEHEAEKSPAVAFYHNNQTGRWLSKFEAIWHPRREDILLVGSMKRPRQIDIISDKGISYPSLEGEDLGSICSLIAYHPTQEIVVGGNSSGRVHYFK